MERKSFLGLVIGAIVGLILLFLVYMFFFQGTPTGNKVRDITNDFFPIGGDNDLPVVGDTEEIPNDQVLPPSDEPFVLPKLRRLSHAPAAGYITFPHATSSEVFTRYIEKSTGHVYDVSDQSLSHTRLSNTTLGVFDHVQFATPLSFVGSMFNENNALIDTFVASLVKIGTTSDYRTVTTSYPRNPESVAVRGTSLFALYEYPLNSDGYLTSITSLKETNVFSSPLSGWNVEWINTSSLLLTTKANSGYDGYAYSYNPNTKKMTELIGPIPGLTAKVNGTLTAMLYSESNDTGTRLIAYNMTKKSGLSVSSVTLPEKCVFSIKKPMLVYCAVPRPMPNGSYPEDWYKGKVSFTDAIVSIDIEKNIETTLVNLEQESGGEIDAVQLTLDSKEHYLFFQNKRDGYVWSYDLR